MSSAVMVTARVYDPQGRVVPGAQVTLRKLPEGTQRTTATDSEGDVTFAGLSPGDYQIEAQARGFQTVTLH